MYLPGTARGAYSGHFCTVLHADVKSEIKTSLFGSAFGDFQSGMTGGNVNETFRIDSENACVQNTWPR